MNITNENFSLYYKKIIKNALWNIGGTAWVFIFQIALIPYITYKMGNEKYGIWSLIWIILSYFGFLELGTGAATIKYMSEYLAINDYENANKMFWTSLWTNIFQGLIGSILIYSTASYAASNIFKISKQLLPEAIIIIKLSSVGLLLSFILGTLNAAASAMQRFDIINKIGAFMSSAQLLACAIILYFKGNLIHVVFSSILIEICSIFWFSFIIKKLIPQLKFFLWTKKQFIKLIIYGGYITISRIIGPILIHTEKILIASLLSVSSLTYYIIPYNLISKLQLLSLSISNALFPTMSEIDSIKDMNTAKNLTVRSICILSSISSLIISLSIIWAYHFLNIWMGTNFANTSTRIFQIICVAFWFNMIADIPLVYLRATKKPYLPAIFHLTELIIYIPSLYLLITKLGLIGAALALTIRTFLDASLMIIATFRELRIPLIKLFNISLNIATTSAILMTSLLLITQTIMKLNMIIIIIYSLIFIIIELFIIWRYILKAEEKEIIYNKIKLLMHTNSR
jgi:O-antigen/teichoic acid export membrane protein